MNQIEKGFVLGFFTGQGSFGGDGKTPQLTLRMHTSHEALLRRLCEILPGSLIYGPYSHGERQYLQWMLRGDVLAGVVADGLFEGLKDWDDMSYARYRDMVDDYFVSGKLRFRSRKRRRMTSSSGGSSTESV